MKYRLILFFLFAAQMLLSAQDPVLPDTFDITRQTIQFPHQYQKWRVQVSAGLSMVRPPKDILESAIQAPLANFHMTLGLPWKFLFEGDITTIIVSNQFAFGPRLSFIHKNMGLKFGWDAAFVFGQLKQVGFNNSSQAWIHYPNISIGYKLKKIAFTLKGELVFVARISTKSGENEVTTSTNFIDGATAGFYMEQRLHKRMVCVVGIKDNYLKFYWPTWMLFSTFNRFYHIPELYISWIL